MFFTYVLALVGLITLVGIAIAAIVISWQHQIGPTDPVSDDPYDEALGAAARMQAAAWTAVHELRALDPDREE
jgi:hypothetical protein